MINHYYKKVKLETKIFDQKTFHKKLLLQTQSQREKKLRRFEI